MLIYYAHHQWKYGTREEQYELSLIRACYRNSEIFNPYTDLDTEGMSKSEIMDACLSKVKEADILIFSSLDGVVGHGCFDEVSLAKKCKKPIFYLHHDRFYTLFGIRKFDKVSSERRYGAVIIPRVPIWNAPGECDIIDNFQGDM